MHTIMEHSATIKSLLAQESITVDSIVEDLRKRSMNDDKIKTIQIGQNKYEFKLVGCREVHLHVKVNESDWTLFVPRVIWDY